MEEPKKNANVPPSSKSQPARRALSLPDTADGDTLLVLPEERDVPPAIPNERRWVIWSAEEWDDSNKKFKKPLRSVRTGRKIGAVEKYLAEFGTFAEARAAAEKFHASGVGFVLLAGDGRVGIDFDHCIHTDENGQFIDPAAWQWLGKWFGETYQEISPSGDGIHALCLGKMPGAKGMTAKQVPNAAEGVTSEGYDHGRFLTFTGQRTTHGVKPLHDCQVSIDKLVSTLTGNKPSASGTVPGEGEEGETRPISLLTARKIHEDNLQALRDAKMGEGNALLNTVCFFAGRLFAAGGFDDETAKQVQNQILDIVLHQWKKPHPEDEAHKTVASGWGDGLAQPLVLEDKWPEVAAAVEELNKEFFAVHKFGGNQFRICSFDKRVFPRIGGWKQVLEVLVPQREKDFKLAYLNKRIKAGESANGSAKIETKAEAWLKHRHRREFTRVVFLPGVVSPPKEYNLWKDFAFKPVKGNCDRYLAHLRENICQDHAENYRWLIQWMAYQVRHPGDVGQSAIVVKGNKGTGKNIFAEGFANLWGQHGIVLGDTHSVTTNFNAHLRDKCLVVADEAFFAADPRQARLLKPLITGSMITIEYKGVDKEQVPNLMRLIIISNDEHVIPATPDERRYFVVTCGERHRRDSQYFGALLEQLNHGGYEALLYHLLHEVDLTGFDVHNPPMTDELKRQVELGLRGIDRVWFDILRTGALPGYERLPDGSVKLRAADLADWANKNGADRWERITPNVAGNLLGTDQRALRPPMGFELKREKNKGAWYRIIPPLAEARKLWEKLRGSCDWPRASGQGELQGEEWELPPLAPEGR